MPKSTPDPDNDSKPFARRLSEMFESDANVQEKIQVIAAARELGAMAAADLDALLVGENERRRLAITEFRKQIEDLRELLENLTAPPWHLAVFSNCIDATPGRQRAVVIHSGAQRLVGAGEGVDLSSFRKGEGVFLSHELNAILAPGERSGIGDETGLFDRRLASGRLVVKWRDEEIILEAAAALDEAELKAGDLVRFSRGTGFAFEKIEREGKERYFLREVPHVGREEIGGLGRQLDTVLSALTATLLEPELAAIYGIRARQSIVLIGPAGVGKTLMVKAAASELKRISGKRVHFAVVKPSEWHDPYVGVTQQNIRRFFEALAEVADAGHLVVVFLDEAESAGRVRGTGIGHHSDDACTALLAELDGFTQRKNVAVVAAGNRKDLIDPALLQRLSDIEIQVPRPDMRAARHIFSIHLPETLPFQPNGSQAGSTREELIETAVSRFYSPNGDNQVCVIRFRDGKARTVAARELASGRVFEQACHLAKQSAFRRRIEEGEHGLRVADIGEGVGEVIERMRTMLTIENAHAYLSDLPQDVGVVAVEPVVRKVKKPGRYLNS